MFNMAKKVIAAVKKVAKKAVKVAPEAVLDQKVDSQAKKEFRKVLEAYKESNPIKYAQKEIELLAKLESL